ncbi:hypothetical protein UT300019_20270 [Clostridium sp. CTA-19]
MNLYKKTLVYGSIISTTVVGLMLIYFIFMIPSLYVDYMEKENFQSIKKIQSEYVKTGNYREIQTKNPTGTVTFKIPKEGNLIYLANKLGTIKIDIKDEELVLVFNKIRDVFLEKDSEVIKEKKQEIKEMISNFKFLKNNPPINLEFLQNDNLNVFKEISSKLTVVDDNTIIFESNSTDGLNFYTTYIATTLNDEEIILSILPVMTPEIGEIKSIIYQSLPMIISTAILLILISTVFFSRKIVIPIEKLAYHADYMRGNEKLYVEPIEVKGSDEIAVLASSLNELYKKLNETFKELENKNKSLYEQNKRQEVFLRASSHQLKTPVAASLLLVDGMINEIGKYKDTKTYLPNVKHKLLSMRKIIDEILYLNYNYEGMEKENLDALDIVSEILFAYEIQIKAKKIQVEKRLKSKMLNTNRELLYKIIDNLINNGINYTESMGNIRIEITEDKLVVTNYGVNINKEILPNIFEPFVSGESGIGGHGLGLYIVSYYSKILGYNITIINIKNGVEATLLW